MTDFQLTQINKPNENGRNAFYYAVESDNMEIDHDYAFRKFSESGCRHGLGHWYNRQMATIAICNIQRK